MRSSRHRLLALCGAAAIGCGTPARPVPQRASPEQLACGADSGRTKAGLYFECHGTGPEVVMLIPAFSMDLRMWAGQVAALEKVARVITYDLRGHGRSTAPMEPYSAVDDLAALMDELGIGSAHLIGLSNGARIALDFALSHPARARSLVLASPGVSGYTGGDFSYMAPVISAIRAGNLEEAADLWAATPLMHIPNDSAAAALVRTMSRDNRSIWSHRANPERPLSPPAIGRLAEVKVPVLVIAGEGDLPDLRRLADTIAQTIPGAIRVVVPGVGHMANLAAPDAFNRAVESFLRSRIADADAAPVRDAARRCPGPAELRVINRTNVPLEVVEYDQTTTTTSVIGVVDPGVSHFPARGEAEVTYALRRFGAQYWLTSDRVDESSRSMYAVERRCR